jgi:hypothetical protein
MSASVLTSRTVDLPVLQALQMPGLASAFARRPTHLSRTWN